MKGFQTRQRFATGLGAGAREARLLRGLTQAEVADRVGIAMEVYGRIERGVLLPSIQTFVGICHVLEADPRVLLGLSGPGSAPAPQQTPEEPPHVRRLTRLARELEEEEVVALQGVAKVMLAGRKRTKG
jgi:transcriptional regulator with XRE-family HTH domain